MIPCSILLYIPTLYIRDVKQAQAIKCIDTNTDIPDDEQALLELMKSFNGISMLMVGNNTYSKSQMEEFTTCFHQTDLNLLNSINAQWEKMRGYSNLKDTPEFKVWWNCSREEGKKYWIEENCTVQEYGNMPIWEPCNYASNMAYYHSFLEICNKNHSWSLTTKSRNGIGKAFSFMAFASSFFHASQTDNANTVDQRVMDMIFFVIYQEAVDSITTSQEAIVKDLSETNRSHSAIEVIDNALNVFVEEPITDWGATLNRAGLPIMNRSIGAFVGLILTLIMPMHENDRELTINITSSIWAFFEDRANGTDFAFFEKEFMPAIIDAAEDMRKALPKREVQKLFKNSIGVVMKLFYAILWQETLLEDVSFERDASKQEYMNRRIQELVHNVTLGTMSDTISLDYDMRRLMIEVTVNTILGIPYFNQLGTTFLPLINNLASTLTSFGSSYSRKDFQNGKNFYPGEETCNDGGEHQSKRFLHAKWHLQTAIAFPDVAILGDETHRIIDHYGNGNDTIHINDGEELWIHSYQHAGPTKPSSTMENLKNISQDSSMDKNNTIEPLDDYFGGIEWLMTGNKEYNNTFQRELVLAMDQLDPNLTKSVAAQWEQIKKYASSGGSPPDDEWKRCNESDHQPKPNRTENNCTVLEPEQIPIWEPCNYASNIPYFHAFIEMYKTNRIWSIPTKSKNAIGKALASLSLVSAFHHASQTKHANSRVIDLIYFAIYQAAVDSLEIKNSNSIIRDLSLIKKNQTANEMVDFFMNMYVETPIANWWSTLKNASFPPKHKSVTAMVILTYMLITPPNEDGKIYTGFAMGKILLILNYTTEEVDFFVNKFTKEVRQETKDIRDKIQLQDNEIKKLFRNFVGVIVKSVYAALWQDAPISISMPSESLFNEIGYDVMPLINDLANALTTFHQGNINFQEGKRLYPGEMLCNRGGDNGENKHPKWHVQTAISVLDVIYLSDEIHRIITSYGKHNNTISRD